MSSCGVKSGVVLAGTLFKADWPVKFVQVGALHNSKHGTGECLVADSSNSLAILQAERVAWMRRQANSLTLLLS